MTYENAYPRLAAYKLAFVKAGHTSCAWFASEIPSFGYVGLAGCTLAHCVLLELCTEGKTRGRFSWSCFDIGDDKREGLGHSESQNDKAYYYIDFIGTK
jgi:hypothetical protein